MTGWSFGWRAAVVAFVLCSLGILAAGWVFTQVDPQYEASSIPGRMVVGVFAGAFAAAILSPISAVMAAVVGVAAGFRHSNQRQSRSA